MSATDDHLDALYQEGLRIRDDWFAAYVANLNRLARELGLAEKFAADFRHILPAPPVVPPPLSSAPLPEMTDVQRQEQYKRWQEAVGRHDDEPIGLDGIPGGMR